MNKKHVLALMGMVYPAAVFAYIDPGSGALLIQGLLALIGAIIVFFRSPLKSIKEFYTSVKNRIKRTGRGGTNHKDNENA